MTVWMTNLLLRPQKVTLSTDWTGLTAAVGIAEVPRGEVENKGWMFNQYQ